MVCSMCSLHGMETLVSLSTKMPAVGFNGVEAEDPEAEMPPE